MTALRRLGAGIAATAALLLPASAAVLLPATTAAAAPIADPEEAAAYGAGWLLDRLNDDGFVPKPDASPDYGATVAVGFGLASAGVGEDAFDAIVERVQANVDAYVKDGGTDRPGALGKLAMLFHAAGEPNDALLDRILATDTGSNPALFADPGYNGLFNHSLALLGLATGEGYTAEEQADIQEALDLLVAQQCPNGGWQNDLRATVEGVLAPCGTSFSGPDTNTTAVVAQALAAWDEEPEVDPLDYSEAVQNDDGGFGYVGGSDTDANSTAQSIQGILAAGGDPGQALGALLRLQLTCAAAPADRGAWAYQPEDDGSLEANAFATLDAVPAAAGATFPLDVVEFGPDDATMPCAAARPSNTVTPRPSQVVQPRPAPPTVAPRAVETLPDTGSNLEKPWDATGLAVFGGGLLGYGLLALAGARFAGRRAG